MKKLIWFVLLLVLAAVLTAAIPLQAVNVADAVQSDYAPANESLGLCYNPYTNKWVPCYGKGVKIKHPGQGEPRMEKVATFYYEGTTQAWDTSKCEVDAVWSPSQYKWYYCVKTYKLPVGCHFRYQY